MSPQVLVVEDNPDNMKLISWVLEDEDFDFSVVESGEDALEIVKHKSFDIILMDIGLPGIDGEETTRRLRANSKYLTVPIVAVTAHALKSEVDRIMSAGFTALTTKPIDEDELVRLMRVLTEGEN